MSNLGRRQLGACEKAFKYEFTLEILRFQCIVPFNCKLKFMWRRNSKSIETKNEIDMRQGIPTELTVNEKLSSISTIILNTDRREFLPKESEIIANMLFSGSPKRLASYALDMRCILDPAAHRASRSQVFEVEMAKHVDTKDCCRVIFRLSSVFKEEMVCSERSLGNGSLNMSGLSIPQEGRYFEKRYEVVPKDAQSVIAKDTHSVASYNPNRYPSAKRDREETSNRKFDYGYLAALKSNILPNDPDSRSHKKSLDNKTETNEGYNRQLADEQVRRSKAEAELAKNKVEIEELKRKLAEVSIENVQLRDRAGREDANALQHRLYQLNNDIRTLRAQLDAAKLEQQRTETQAKAARAEKGMLEGQLLKRQKRLQGLEGLQNENNQLRHQVESLRRAVEEARRQAQERESQVLTDKYREQQEASGKLESLRRENDRLRLTANTGDLLQKSMNELEIMHKATLQELNTKTRYIFGVERETEEYKTRLSQYETERVSLQRELIRLKNENADRSDRAKSDLEQRLETQRGELSKMQEQLAVTQQAVEERQRTVQRLQQERLASDGRVNRLLAQANDTQKRVGELEGECRGLRERAERAEQLNEEMSQEATRVREVQVSSASTTSGGSSEEADRLFRESLQLQVDLKFATDELQRLREVEEKLHLERWQAEHEKTEREAGEKELELKERELAVKNRALMVEVEKTRMMTQKINELEGNCELLREELERSRSIIHNGQQQLSAFEASIHELQSACSVLEAQNARLSAEQENFAASSLEMRQLQLKVKELEERNAEKLATLEANDHSLRLANREAKESQRLAEERLGTLLARERQLGEAQSRVRELEGRASAVEGEAARAGQERRVLEKRMQVVMEEMHSMKKRYEEEKGRSVSFTRNEDLHRLRTLESELEKKEKTVSKLSKEKLELEEENVKMNVQIMKMYSELEKYKSNTHSLKFIPTSTK